MFLTQIYGTIVGGFINYAVMISIVGSNRELLANTDGSSSWSGAYLQAFNTNASSWALAKYLYKAGGEYYMVPVGLAVGAGLVALQRLIIVVSFRCESLNHQVTDVSSFAVPSQDWQIQPRRDQHASVLAVCWFHPIQPVSDLRHSQLDHRRLLLPILPP